jgi:predicted membrane-bound mannosyltransferase
MQMTVNRSACLAVVAIAAMTSAVADARPIHHRSAAYPYFPRATVDRIGDGPFQYRGNYRGNFFYGADRAPYGYGGAGTEDFQLEGR